MAVPGISMIALTMPKQAFDSALFGYFVLYKLLDNKKAVELFIQRLSINKIILTIS